MKKTIVFFIKVYKRKWAANNGRKERCMTTLQAEEDGDDKEQVYSDVKEAIEFMQTFRGRYIIGQALFYAIKEMESVEEVHQEKSNIEDMKYLKNQLFNFPDEMYISQAVEEN